MSKFKKGDRIQALVDLGMHLIRKGDIHVIDHIDGDGDIWLKDNLRCASDCCAGKENNWSLVTNQGEKTMARRTFKLIKDTPTHKKGQLFQEQCDDGTQPYVAYPRHEGVYDSYTIDDRSLVEDQPQWFVEVFKVEPEYQTQQELDRWEAFKKGKTTESATRKRSVGRPVGSNNNWTPARRKAHGKKIAAARKRNKANK